jgi:hypothetical protein
MGSSPRYPLPHISVWYSAWRILGEREGFPDQLSLDRAERIHQLANLQDDPLEDGIELVSVDFLAGLLKLAGGVQTSGKAAAAREGR